MAAIVVGLGGVAAISVHNLLAQIQAAPGEQGAAKDTEKKEARPAPDQTEIVGTWESSEMGIRPPRAGDEKPPVPEQIKTRWIITADKIITVDEEGFIDQEFRYWLDSQNGAKTIDLTSHGFWFLQGIYRLEGSNLKIYCSGGKGEARPSRFPDKDAGCWILRRVAPGPQPVQRYPNAPGYFWIIKPTSARIACMSSNGVSLFYDKENDGATTITLACAVSFGQRMPAFQHQVYPVLLDAENKRFHPKFEGGGTGGGQGLILSHERWRMDPKILPADKVAMIGIEMETRKDTRLASRDATKRAKKEGIEVLPWPQLGKEYPVTLTTIDGRRIGPAQLKGKVVVIDCWVSWRSPCMAELLNLKRMYEKWHKNGLEIVGVSLEMDADLVRKICKAKGLDWPQVLAPTDAKAHEMWKEAAGIESVPRVFLLDREGKLRADNPSNLEEEIAKLLKE